MKEQNEYRDIMSVSEQEQVMLAQGEWRMTTMNEVHDIMGSKKGERL